MSSPGPRPASMWLAPELPRSTAERSNMAEQSFVTSFEHNRRRDGVLGRPVRDNGRITIRDNQADRKSVGKGKSGSVRVDIGGRRSIKKKKKKKIKHKRTE